MTNNESKTFKQLANYIKKTYIGTLPSKQRVGKYITSLTKEEKRKLSLEIIKRIKTLVHSISNDFWTKSQCKQFKEEIEELEWTLTQLNPNLIFLHSTFIYIGNLIEEIERLKTKKKEITSSPDYQATKPRDHTSKNIIKETYKDSAPIGTYVSLSLYYSQQDKLARLEQAITRNKKIADDYLDSIVVQITSLSKPDREIATEEIKRMLSSLSAEIQQTSKPKEQDGPEQKIKK